MQYKKILVPVDGSKNGELAVTKAVFTAKRNHAHLDIVSIIQTSRFLDVYGHMGSNTDYLDITYRRTQEYVEMLRDAIKEKYDFDDVSISVESGNAGKIIAELMPQQFGSDLIMMGATGMSALQRTMIGSVADYVVRVATCDVLLVRTDLNNKRQ
ncbi:Universal stress protein family [Pediococcus damnosus]|uniref:Universal stress protein n=1 Tax=Pediococcus damnosus TaxID=51663 RepID=A0A0R2HP94_9LACO|nr:universal stress protein [Pediococcus damnosus]AMV60723.1 Universal stress protein family [Pediococcus damnosus]AMV63319.1 Universal stress protein family [Pediococcus damnosus]AMV65036.1 Universal stress protein family [Pediococcus damnosus]AMV66781.1 Universal stress protein family [Pediococcus damnosus]AMV69855.1 Universal stress protein family [Pediococcus damnosus]